MEKTRHSVLLNFDGKDYDLYLEIHKLATKNNFSVSTYMRLLLRAGLGNDLIIKQSEKAENRNQEQALIKKSPAKTGIIYYESRNEKR